MMWFRSVSSFALTMAGSVLLSAAACKGQFAIIDGAIRNGTKPLTVEYHPTLGYPTRIALGDPAVDAPLYTITDLRPR